MAAFSTNQNRQLYVVKSVESTLANIKGSANLGKVFVGTDADGNKFINQNGYGGIVRSDLIKPASIMWANASAPADMQRNLKLVELTLKSTVNSGAPISGQDYVLRINFRQLYGMSDEDIYQKYGAVHAVSGMTASDFYKAMIYSLVKNFSRLYAPLLEIAVNSYSANNVVTKATNVNGTIHLYNAAGSEIVASVTKILICEKSQVSEWALGTKQLVPVYFEVIPTTVTDAGGNDVVWGDTVTKTDPSATGMTPVGNGYNIADLEYFCMGERGDQYRNVGWPNSIQTKYFVDPESTYYVLDVHYAFQGTCEDIQKSEKTITFVAKTKAIIDSLIEKLGIGTIVKATDLYDGTADGQMAYPEASLEDRVEDLEQYNEDHP